MVEVAGRRGEVVQPLEATGIGNHWQRKVQSVEAAATKATRVQPEGAANIVRVQPGKGAANVVGKA